MLGNDFVLRSVLGAGKVHSVVGPNITIGRDTGSRIVLVDDSTSLAHAEITILDGEALLRDAGSDAGTFYGQQDEEGLRRLDKDESVALGEGDRVGFGQGESELYRVERTPDGKRNEAGVSLPHQLQAGSTTHPTVEHNESSNPNGNGEDDEDREESDHTEDQQPLLSGSVGENTSVNEDRFGVVVTVVRAEGLPGATSGGVFRRAKQSQTHRRYVRVSIVDKSEGRDQRLSAVTSYVTGGGPTCRWGEKGGGGESVYLGVDGRENIAVLELEVWSDHSEGGTEDILVCSGQTNIGDVGLSQPRWVVLDPKGKVEISVTFSPPVGDRVEQLDQSDRESALERDGRTLPLETDHAQEEGANTEDPPEEISPENPPEPRSPKWGMPRMPGLKNTLNISLGRAANLRAKQREEPPVNRTNKESVGTVCQAEDTSQRADKVEDERQSISGDERELQVIGENSVPSEHIAQGDKANRGAMRGIQSIKESLQTIILGANSGKLPTEGVDTLNKEVEGDDLQDGGRDLPSESRESFSSTRRSSSPSSEPMERDDLDTSQAHFKRENSQKLLSRDRTGSASSIDGGGHAEKRRSGYQSPLRSLLEESAAGDHDTHESEEGEEDDNNERGGNDAVWRDTGDDERTSQSHAHAEKGTVAQVDSALDATSAVKAAASRFKSTLSSPTLGSALKGMSRDKTGSASSIDGGGLAERRRSDYQSPLRSLLQETAGGDQGAHESEKGEDDDNNERGGNESIWRHTGDDEDKSESHAEKGPIAQAASAPDATSAVKAAASRFKSTLSSPKLGSTLKGFGWNRPTKEEVVEGVPSSPSASSCDAGRISSTTPTGVDGGDEASKSATQLGGSSDPHPLILDATTTMMLVTIYRASDLREILSKNMFGRTKKNSSQDPFVRLTVCGVTASTSAVQGGGCECRWGNNKEGSIVEISIPSLNVPGSGIGASKMVVEVWNKASDELEKDILLGSTEILVADWLGKKAKWVALDASKRSQGGRVKLGVSLKDGDGASSIPPNGSGSDEAPVDSSTGASGPKYSEADLSVPERNSLEEVAQEGEAVSDTEKVRSRERSKAAVPPLALGPFSDEDQQEPPLLEKSSAGPSTPDVEQQLEQQQGVIAEATEGEGGQEIDVNSPAQRQNVPSTGRCNDLEIIGAEVDEDQSWTASPDKPSNSAQKSSEVLEGRGREGDHHGREKEMNWKGQDIPLNLGGEPMEKNASIDLSSPAASNGSSAGSLDTVPKKQESRSSGVDISPTSLLKPDETHPFELLRQQSEDSGPLTPQAGGGGVEGNEDESTTAEDAGDARTVHGLKNGENTETSSEVRNCSGGSDALARRVVGGTATTLDLTAGAQTSDQRADNNIAEEQSTEEASTSPSTEHRPETPQSNPQGSGALCQNVVIAGKKSDSYNRRSHGGQDAERPRRLRGSRDVRASGDSGDGSRDRLEGLENGRREIFSEEMAKNLDAQPREQTETREVDAQRVARAREIVRRHRAAVSSRGHTSPGVQTGRDVAVSTTMEQSQAATTIQSAFHGRFARRTLRLRQRAVIKIQAAYRGHVERKEFVALRIRAKRAKAEEKRARARRSRIAFITQELDLLRNTPAQQLLRVDALRAEACATRIQRFWRRVRGPKGVSRLCESGGRDKAPKPSCMENRKHSLTAPEISSRSNRVPLSGITLEALRLRVANRQRTQEHYNDSGGAEDVLTRKHSSDKGLNRQTNGTADTTYETLLQCQERASQLTAAFHRAETKRLAAAKRRRERLTNFRKTQDQLLRPPKLHGSGHAHCSAEQFESTTSEGSRRRHILDIVTDKSWNLAEEPAQRDRARRAHTLAVAAAKGRGRKAWATSLPPDVGYDELVDIRSVQVPSWPTTSLGRGGCPDFVDGFIRNRPKPSGQMGSRPTDREFDSDEASLWWYTYAREGVHTMGLPRGDHVFEELLERAKTTPTRRKEHIEREEQQYQLRVAQKRQRIIDKVIHKQQVASCPRLSRVRRHATQAQWCAAVCIQAYIRGFLERKATAVMRAEMRVFGALQILVNELRQPELEEGDTTNSLAVLLADRMNGQGESRGRVHRTGRRSRSPRGGYSGPTSPVPAIPVAAVSSIG